MGNQGNANILGSPLLETAFYEYLQRFNHGRYEIGIV